MVGIELFESALARLSKLLVPKRRAGSVLMQRLRSHPFDHPASYGVPHALQLSFLEAFPTLKEFSLESLWVRTGCLTIQRRALEGLVRS